MKAGSRSGVRRRALLIGALAAAAALPAAAQQAEPEPVRPTAGPALDLAPGQARESFIATQLSFPRVSFARVQKGPSLQQRFATLGLPFPPAGLYLRVFKVERVVEVWVLPQGGERYAHLVSYPVCAVSGWLGPKRGQGDLQIPEGFYEVESFNPMSEYHLSLRLNYPNEADRRAQPGVGSLGGDIYVHGGCKTIGCVPITDEHIRELYWLAVQARAGGARTIPVHVFPTRLDEAGLSWLGGFFGGDAQLMDFWSRMQEGYAFFERERRVPGVGVDRSGRYVVGEPGAVTGFALLGTPAAPPAPERPARAQPTADAVPGLLGQPVPSPLVAQATDAVPADSAPAPAEAAAQASDTVEASSPAARGLPARRASGAAPAQAPAAPPADPIPGLLGVPTAPPPAAAAARDGASAPDSAGTAVAVGADAASVDPAASSAVPGGAEAAAASAVSGSPVASAEASPTQPAEGAAAPAADPIPGLLGTPTAPPAVPTGTPELAGRPMVVEAGGAVDREDGSERGSRRLLGRPKLLGMATEGGPSLHASFLIPIQQRTGDGGTHGIPWRIHVRRPAW